MGEAQNLLSHFMRAVLSAVFKAGGQLKTSSVSSGSSLGEVLLYPQVLTECDSSGILFHVNLFDDCCGVTKILFSPSPGQRDTLRCDRIQKEMCSAKMTQEPA